MKRLLVLLALMCTLCMSAFSQVASTCATDPQSSPSCPGYRTYHTMGDDTWVNVPLQFPFPFYGKIFTNSFMFSNGVVGFFGVNQQPVTSFCCTGENISTSTWSGFNYTIMPLQTDLFPVANSKFWTEGSSTYQKYYWENVVEYSSRSNMNSFGVEIRPNGYIGIKYDKVNVNQLTTSAIVGDASLGEYTVNFHGSNFTTSTVPSLIEFNGTSNACLTDPLSSTSCPGYAEAYYNQQCSINPLYATSCPGYSQAYFNQQCSVNPLYSSSCPEYAQAYFNYQCNLDPLYSNECPGYKEAYALKYLVTTSPTVAETATNSTSLSTPSTGSLTTDSILATPSTTSATSVTSVTSVIAPRDTSVTGPAGAVAATVTAPASVSAAKVEERKEDQKKTDGAVASVEKKSGGDPKAAKAAATEKAKELANEVSKAATLEQQAAQQGLVVGLMGYVPGFSAYQNSIVPDVLLSKVSKQYGQPPVDNRSVQRQLSSANEKRWQEIVDSQYNNNKGK